MYDMSSSRWRIVSPSNLVVLKMVSSGWKKMTVPCPRNGPSFSNLPCGRPFENVCWYSYPSFRTVATSFFDSAFTTLAPTPCSPPL